MERSKLANRLSTQMPHSIAGTHFREAAKTAVQLKYVRPRLLLILLVNLTAFCLVRRACAQSSLDAALPEGAFSWHSESRTIQKIPRDLTVLYFALARAGRLETKQSGPIGARKPMQVMRDEHLIYGPYFPKDLNDLLCALNTPALCDISERSNAENEIVVTNTRWHNTSTDRLLLPSISLWRAPDPLPATPYRKRADESLGEIVVVKRQGCDQLDDRCRALIRNYNLRKPEVLEGNYAGILLVPTLAVKAEIPEERSAQRPLRIRLRFIAKPASILRVDISRPIEARSPGQSMINVPASEYAQSLKDTYNLINFVPPARLIFRTTVAVFDRWVDPQHCDFQLNQKDSRKISICNRSDDVRGPSAAPTSGALPALQGAASGAPQRIPEPSVCSAPALMSSASSACNFSQIDTNPDPVIEHGTHVAGIIGADSAPGGFGGINPTANLLTYEVFSPDNKITASNLDYNVNRAGQSISPPAVFNLSLTYPKDDSDPSFENRLKYTCGEYLFVSAAGDNHGAPVMDASACSSNPGCYQFPNTLSVIGLTDSLSSPAVSQSSTYGDHFDIGAPADGVWSTIGGSKFGPLSGSSQATAIVSAAASLLFNKNFKLTPSQVKDRLIYSSSLFPTLVDSARGGRLNVQNALDFETDRLEVASSPSKVDVVRGEADDDFEFYYQQFNAPQIPITMSQVLRIHRYDQSPDNLRYTLFLIPSTRGTRIRRVDAYRIGPLKDTQLHVVRPGAATPIPFDSIVDYIARVSKEADQCTDPYQ
jgi:hypothetical protein